MQQSPHFVPGRTAGQRRSTQVPAMGQGQLQFGVQALPQHPRQRQTFAKLVELDPHGTAGRAQAQAQRVIPAAAFVRQLADHRQARAHQKGGEQFGAVQVEQDGCGHSGTFKSDGALPTGGRAGEGAYVLKLTAKAADGTAIDTRLTSLGQVQELVSRDGELWAGLGGVALPMNKLVRLAA
jgi:hypothetical protein